LRGLSKNYPRGLLPRIWRNPEIMKDPIQLSRFLSVDDNILLVDIGAYTGHWAQAFLDIFQRSSVKAFEPDSSSLNKYAERFINRENVDIHEIALSNKSGFSYFHIAESSAYSSLESSNILNRGESEYIKKKKVKLSTLDEMDIETSSFDRIFVKIVVQGHEAQVIKGGANFFKNVDVVLVETSFSYGDENTTPSFPEVVSALHSSGLYPIIFQDYGRKLGPYAWQRSVIFVRADLLSLAESWTM